MMRTTRVVLVLMTVALTALAGCSSKDSAGSGATTGQEGQVNTEQAIREIDVKPTATTGIIRGIVVDEGIRPIAKALVAVQTGEKILYTNTTSLGAFGFQGLLPGVYFVKAHHAGYNDIQVNVEVRANVADPPLTRIQLSTDDSFIKPYFEPFVFKGIIECSGTFIAVGYAVCSAPNQATCGLDPVPCSGNVTQDSFAVKYPLSDPMPTWIQSELVWDSTQALGSTLSVMYSRDCSDTFLCDHDATGESPLLLVAKTDEIGNITYQDGTKDHVLYIRVFNAGIPESAVIPVGGGLGFTFEQGFTVYTTVFHGFVPPEGYRFTVDGEPKVPSA